MDSGCREGGNEGKGEREGRAWAVQEGILVGGRTWFHACVRRACALKRAKNKQRGTKARPCVYLSSFLPGLKMPSVTYEQISAKRASYFMQARAGWGGRRCYVGKRRWRGPVGGE